MSTVDIERGSDLDKVHAQRMFHAYSNVLLGLIALQNPEVDDILRYWGVAIFPGPIAGIEYPYGAKQILAERLKDLNQAATNAKKLVESKPKSGKRK